MPVIPALVELRKEDKEFEASLGMSLMAKQNKIRNPPPIFLKFANQQIRIIATSGCAVTADSQGRGIQLL